MYTKHLSGIYITTICEIIIKQLRNEKSSSKENNLWDNNRAIIIFLMSSTSILEYFYVVYIFLKINSIRSAENSRGICKYNVK